MIGRSANGGMIGRSICDCCSWFRQLSLIWVDRQSSGRVGGYEFVLYIFLIPLMIRAKIHLVLYIQKEK